MPHAQEKGITRAKVRRVSKVMERIDLLRDNGTKERFIDHAAAVPLPA
jgi:hypothetical protein